MRSVFGWGSLKLRNTNGSISIQFQNVVHSISYIKSNYRQTAITGKIHQTLVKYRPLIKAQITICNEFDYDKLLDLVTLLNNYPLNGLHIMPQNSTTNSINDIQYSCYLDSSTVNFEHIADAQIGQVLTIQFIGRNTVSLPLNFSSS